MEKKNRLLHFLLSFFLMLAVLPHYVHAQEVSSDTIGTAAEKVNTALDSLQARIDSSLDARFQKMDSLFRAMQEEPIDTVGSQGGDAKQALTQLEQVISWQKVMMVIILFIVVYYLSQFLSLLLDNFSERVSRYRLKIKRMVPIIRVVIWFIAIYVAIAGIIQPPYATVITVMASIGIAVGLAAQDMLKNLFGGFMLILDRPFQVGDKIQFAEHYGEVQQIGLRSSRIVTPGDSVVTIPNGELIRTAVSNANTGALDCQVITEIFLPADAPVEEVKEIAYKAVVSSRYVYMAKPISIITKNEMHERRFILKMKVKAYVLDIRYEFPFQSDVTELILSKLSERGIIKDELPGLVS